MNPDKSHAVLDSLYRDLAIAVASHNSHSVGITCAAYAGDLSEAAKFSALAASDGLRVNAIIVNILKSSQNANKSRGDN